MNEIDAKIFALRRPIWRVTEVRAFLECSKSKAYREIALCRLRLNGGAGKETEVYRDKFLEMCGTNYEAEMRNAYIEKEAMNDAKKDLHQRNL